MCCVDAANTLADELAQRVARCSRVVANPSPAGHPADELLHEQRQSCFDGHTDHQRPAWFQQALELRQQRQRIVDVLQDFHAEDRVVRSGFVVAIQRGDVHEPHAWH